MLPYQLWSLTLFLLNICESDVLLLIIDLRQASHRPVAQEGLDDGKSQFGFVQRDFMASSSHCYKCEAFIHLSPSSNLQNDFEDIKLNTNKITKKKCSEE